MHITELNDRPTSNEKLIRSYTQFSQLLNELRKKDLSPELVLFINESIAALNLSTAEETQLIKLLKQKEIAILKQAEKLHNIVLKNYNRNLWMLFGMSGIGLPLGVAFGLSMGNIGLLGIGFLPGMAIGLAIGISLDKKALKEGRQLDFEIKR